MRSVLWIGVVLIYSPLTLTIIKVLLAKVGATYLALLTWLALQYLGAL